MQENVIRNKTNFFYMTASHHHYNNGINRLGSVNSKRDKDVEGNLDDQIRF